MLVDDSADSSTGNAKSSFSNPQKVEKMDKKWIGKELAEQSFASVDA